MTPQTTEPQHAERRGAIAPPTNQVKPFARVAMCCVGLLALGCTSWPGPEPLSAPTPGQARGVVFEDLDADGVRDEREPGVAGVRVSNGQQVVVSDRAGRWTLPVSDDTALFVVKPSGMRTAIDDRNLPRFYYLHKPSGSPSTLTYPAVPPTGPLPESIEFPLYRQHESSPFRVLVLGDPQPQSVREVDYFLNDIVAELPDHDAAFGVTLGDIVNHDLALYDPMTQATRLVGIPWYHLLGNHDMNLDAPSERTSDETFERVFGPSTYAFTYADVHFVVLDNVMFRPASQALDRPAAYRGGLAAQQLRFVEQYVATVPRNERIVLLMHIPLVGHDVHQVPERAALFEILADHRYTLSISGHSHMQAHAFLGEEAGNPGAIHHHWNSPTTSGSWWRGRRDERGIPHATMRDGSPNGYSIVTFDGLDYSIRFKAARRPASHQMHVDAPSEVAPGQAAEVWANVFAGSERSTVEMRIVATGTDAPRSWTPMLLTRVRDPAFMRLQAREETGRAPDEAALPFASESLHLWKGTLPEDLPLGSHMIEVRSTDIFGQVDLGRRAIRVAPSD